MSESVFSPYPWQASQWQGLVKRQRERGLPHALLFTGRAGLGKTAMARGLAQFILCEQPGKQDVACGVCRACQLFAAGTHPDFTVIEPEEEGKAIGVDAIRSLSRSQSLKGQYAGGKVVLLTPADRLNANAANALLKTLEEPTPGTILILCTDRPMSLLPTIRSRCQSIAFHPASTDEALPWLRQHLQDANDAEQVLAMAAGSPLTALAWANEGVLEQRQGLFQQLEELGNGQGNPLAIANQWKDAEMARSLEWINSWTVDMIRLKSAPRAVCLNNRDLDKRLLEWAERVDIKILYRILDKIRDTARLLAGQANRQLMMEELLLSWEQAFRR